MAQLHKLHTAIHLLVSRSNCTSVSDVQQNLHQTGLYSCCIVVVDSQGVTPVIIAVCFRYASAFSFFVKTLDTIDADGTWKGNARCGAEVFFESAKKGVPG